jgi:LacI family transcriptional regulator
MRRRVTIEELRQATGLSRATIDRALNGRAGVHPRSRKLVEDAIAALSATSSNGPERAAEAPEIDLVLRLGRGMTAQLVAAVGARRSPPNLIDLEQGDEQRTLAVVRELCQASNRPLILAVKNSEALCDELMAARRRGKRVVAFVSDLDPAARDAFVGIDNRKAGQTAAFLLGTVLRGRAARVGVVLGDFAFRCHEDREIGFRARLRADYPDVSLADAIKGEDSREQTYEAARALLQAEPGIAALYNVGGGNAGLIAAIRDAGRVGDLIVVAHETNATTMPAAREGLIQFLIGQDTEAMLDCALALAAGTAASPAGLVHFDFHVFTPFNLPAA